MDPLSLLLNRFAVKAGVFYTGQICGVHAFPEDGSRGHLHVIEQGPVDLVGADGCCRRIEKPTLLFLPRPERHRIVADDDSGAKVLCAHVQFGGGNNNPISMSLPAVIVLALDDFPAGAMLLGLAEREASKPGPGTQACVDRLCELLIIHLLRFCLDRGLTCGGTLAGMSDPRLAQVIAAVHTEPAQPWQLEEMAQVAGLSRARFAAHFRSVTGQTPADYLASWRISLAQGLLRNGRALKQVSVESGYGSSSAFIRAFVRKVGVPPTAWLKQIGSQPAAGQKRRH